MGQLPMGEVPEQWQYGDVEAGLKEAALVVDETFVVQSTPHAPMEPRSSMAYWRNGKLFIHTSTQSTIRTVPGVATASGIEQDDVVLISEYCGGGFGSKGGGPVWLTSIPALLSKKTNAPVMMRISREEEHFVGRSRTNMTGRVKIGFRKDGRITALDLFVVQDNGAYNSMGDFRSVGDRCVADLSAALDAVAWRERLHQHATAHAAAVARADAGQRHGRRRRDEGGEAARDRSSRDPPHSIRPRAGRPFGGSRPDGTRGGHLERVRQTGARSRCGSCSTGTSGRRARASASAARCAASASPSGRTAPARSGSTAS